MDVSTIFIIFLLGGGEGKGESEAPGRGGGRFFIENPRRGGVLPRGAGRVSAGNFAKYFFWGPKCPPRSSRQRFGGNSCDLGSAISNH